MLPGPVFLAELLTTARRARYYAARSLLGLALLLALWWAYSRIPGLDLFSTRTLSIGIVSRFAMVAFAAFAVAQGVAVALLTPALVAGTIADEKGRKTLHYLLASQLSGVEIVLGKLAARLLHVGVFLLAGVPILSGLTLFGGVGWGDVAAAYGLTVALAAFLAGLSLLVSVSARDGRRAILAAYGWVLGLLGLPMFLSILEILWPRAFAWQQPVLGWLYPLWLPFQLLGLDRLGLRGVPAWWGPMLQVGYGTLCVVVAARRLRSAAFSGEGRPKREMRIDAKGRWRWRILPRPPVGDDPMLWKEMHTSRLSGWIKLAGFLFALFLAVLIGCVAFESARSAWGEMEAVGARPWREQLAGSSTRNRAEFNTGLRHLTGLLTALWMLGAAVLAASSIAGEREGDTWISLIASPLEGRAILRAKRWGAILRFQALGWMLAALWATGLVVGSVHPLGLVAAALGLAAAVGFAAALGVRLSLTARSSARALVATVGLLVLLNGGYLLAAMAFSDERVAHLAIFVAPFSVGGALAPPWDVEALWQALPVVPWGRLAPALDGAFGAVMIGIPTYLAATLALIASAGRKFDAAVDRPHQALATGGMPES